MKNIIKIVCLLAFLITISCGKDFVDTEPTAEIPGENLITDLASAESALNGMYSALKETYVYGGFDTFGTGLYSDELIHTGSYPSYAQYGVNNVASDNKDLILYWDAHYAAIYRANLIIQSTQNPDFGFSETATERIVGQARGIRSLLFYNLVKVFGGVPLTIVAYTSAIDIDNNPLPRASKEEVYAQIIQDVQYAYEYLPDELSRFQFNQDAATVLKAIVEMELDMYAEAKATLEPIIGSYSLEADYASLFTGTASATETIFAIDFDPTDGGEHANSFLKKGRGEVTGSAALVNAFEEKDTRNVEITKAGEILKYKDAGSGDDDAYVFRYAEVLLMYAEILARLDDPNASNYLNMVRERAGVGDIEINSSNVVDIIADERFVEFYGESSNRLHTITRLGIADELIQTKPGKVIFIKERNNLWPIPQQEIERNSEISSADQNPGY